MVREYAAESLGKLGDKRAIEPLVNLLRENDYEIRCSIALSLDLLCQPELIPLITALQTGDRNLREGAAVALGKIGNKYTVVQLIFALKDEDKGVRSAVANALGRLKDEKAVVSNLDSHGLFRTFGLIKNVIITKLEAKGFAASAASLPRTYA